MPKRRRARATVDAMRCPCCDEPLALQYDTQADEPFWHCFDCDESFAVDGRPAICMTAVALEELEA